MSRVRRDRRLTRALGAYSLFAVVESGAWIAILLVAFGEGGARLAGVVGIVQLLVAVLIAPALGIVGDRLPRGTALCGTYLVMAVAFGLAAALLWFDAPLACVVAASSLANTALSVARPIHYASLPQLAPTPMSLVSANSVTEVLVGVGAFVGPVLAGVLAQVSGTWAALAGCAVLMLAAATLTTGLGLPVAAAPPGERVVRAAADGVRVVARDAGLLALLLVVTMSFVVVGALDILAIAFTDEVLDAGDSTVGLLAGAVGVGVLLGAALAAGIAFRARLVVTVVLGLGAVGLPLMVMAHVVTLPAAALIFAVSGVGKAVAAVAAKTLLQRGTDDRVLARVFAVHEAALLLGLALGTLAAPLLVSWVGAAGAFVPLGGAVVIVALIAWIPIRRLDARAVFRPDVLAAMREVPFLAAMLPPALERLSHSAAWVEAGAGQVVISQGEHGDALYIVESGRLSVAVDGVLRPHVIGPGDSFGEIALMQDVARTATVAALEPCRLLRIERDDFLAAVTGSSDGHGIAAEVAASHLARDRDPVTG